MIVDVGWCGVYEDYEDYFAGTQSILPENNWHKSGEQRKSTTIHWKLDCEARQVFYFYVKGIQIQFLSWKHFSMSSLFPSSKKPVSLNKVSFCSLPSLILLLNPMQCNVTFYNFWFNAICVKKFNFNDCCRICSNTDQPWSQLQARARPGAGDGVQIWRSFR